MSYIVTAGAMTLAACVSATSVTAAIAPNPGLIVAALALSVVLVGLWAYRWAKQHVATGRSGLVTRVNARPRSTEAQIVVTRRRWSIHNTSLFAKILTFSVIVSGAVKLMSLQGKMAMLSVSAWLFAWLGALAVGHALYVLRLTRVWERKHGAPLIEANRSDKSEER
jgi:hypothetical protein